MQVKQKTNKQTKLLKVIYKTDLKHLKVINFRGDLFSSKLDFYLISFRVDLCKFCHNSSHQIFADCEILAVLHELCFSVS